MKNVLVVYNTNAGRKKSVLYKKKLQKFLLANVESFKFITIDELETTDINLFDTIVAMGGDGTVHKVLPKLVDTDKTLGIMPCGTANLLAEKLGISANFNKALKVFREENKTKIDILGVNGVNEGVSGVNEGVNSVYCALRLGLGYDSDIICKTPQSLKHKFGYFAYFVAGILFALRLKKKEYFITIDGDNLTVEASCIIVANATNMYRTWVSVSKKCSLNDGLMDVFILKTTNPILYFFELLRMIFKQHKTNNNAMYFKTKTLSIKNKWMNAHIDGEKKNFKESIDVNVEKLSINVIYPKK